MKNDTEYLEQMIGNTYEFEGETILITDVRIKGNIASLITDKEVVELPMDGLDDYLPEFKLKKTNHLVKNPEVVEMVMGSGNMYSQIQQTLLDSIQKIQADKEYIPQAIAINDTIKQVIDLEKVKIQTLQLLK